MMRLAEADRLSGIKGQFEDWDGPKMNVYWSLRRMVQSDVTMTYRAILRSLHWET